MVVLRSHSRLVRCFHCGSLLLVCLQIGLNPEPRFHVRRTLAGYPIEKPLPGNADPSRKLRLPAVLLPGQAFKPVPHPLNLPLYLFFRYHFHLFPTCPILRTVFQSLPLFLACLFVRFIGHL